jgi:hypothetical protein
MRVNHDELVLVSAMRRDGRSPRANVMAEEGWGRDWSIDGATEAGRADRGGWTLLPAVLVPADAYMRSQSLMPPVIPASLETMVTPGGSSLGSSRDALPPPR